jgi:hypothetical protein
MAAIRFGLGLGLGLGLDVPWTVTNMEVFLRMRLTEVADALLEWDQCPKVIVGLLLEYLSSSDWMSMWLKPNSSPLQNLWWLLRFARDSPSPEIHARLLELAAADPTTLSQLRCLHVPSSSSTTHDEAMPIKLHERWKKAQTEFVARNGYTSQDSNLQLSTYLSTMVAQRQQYASVVPLLDESVMKDECTDLVMSNLIAGQCIAFLEELCQKEWGTMEAIGVHTRDTHDRIHQTYRWNCIIGVVKDKSPTLLDYQIRLLTFLEDTNFLTPQLLLSSSHDKTRRGKRQGWGVGAAFQGWGVGAAFMVMIHCLVQCLIHGSIGCLRWMIVDKRWDIEPLLCQILHPSRAVIFWNSFLQNSLNSWRTELITGRHPNSFALVKFLVEECKIEGETAALFRTVTQRRQSRTFRRSKRLLPTTNSTTTNNLTTATTATNNLTTAVCVSPKLLPPNTLQSPTIVPLE